MKIIGINSGYDAAKNKIYAGGCALLDDGKIIISLAEDRISRNKNDGGFFKSLEYIYKEYGLSTEQIDYFYISFYGNPIIPNEEIIKFHLMLLDLSRSPEKLVVMPSHHISHACLAHFLSPFDESLIMVADNEGCLLSPKDAAQKSVYFNDCERNSYYWAHNNCITLIGRDFENAGEVSFGQAYSKFNEFIGFGNYLSVGKTMGLSSYGHIPPEWADIDMWGIDSSGKLYAHMLETHDSYKDIVYFFKRHNLDVKPGLNYECDEYKNLAHYVQQQLNKWSIEKMRFLINKFGKMNICVSGGVGLNSIMNEMLETHLDVQVFVPPYCSDPGQALGNAIYGYVCQTGLNNNTVIKKINFGEYLYLGTEYDDDRITKAILQEYQNDDRVEILFPDKPLHEFSRLISENKIVGFYQGRSEYGARALGNRSILAMPNSIEIRDRVNTLKGRELFRPLAPAVLSEYREHYFEGGLSILDYAMLRVVQVKDEKRSIICGTTHFDGSARLQVVEKKYNPRFYELIKEVDKLTGIPVIINTSFNSAGEPIVETPRDAIESFLAMNLDALLCGNCLILPK